MELQQVSQVSEPNGFMSSRERSLANLKTWEKGKSGNPGGFPKGYRAVSQILRELGALELDPDKPPTARQLYKMLREKHGAITQNDRLAVGQFLAASEGIVAYVSDSQGNETPVAKATPSTEAAKLILDRTEGPIVTADAAGTGGIVVVNLGVGFGLPSAAKTQVIDTQALIGDSERVTSDNTHYVKFLEPAQVVDSEWDGLGLG